jgi:predicted NAD/FAD-binding protein
MRVAIIGAGVAGMATAWFLQHGHEVTLFDREAHLGGHALTCPVSVRGHRIHAETGPRFFWDASYPYVVALFRLLGLRLTWCEMRLAFFHRARRHTLVLPPRSLRQVLSLVRSPRMLRHVLSLQRLSQAAHAVSLGRDWSQPMSQYLQQNGYPAAFGREFLYPFLAACWGAPLEAIHAFPAYSLMKGLQPARERRSGSYEIDGGTAAYMRAFGGELTRVDIRLGVGVRRIRHAGGFHIEDERGRERRFDQVVIATSSRDAVELLSGLPLADELLAILRRFRHFPTEIVVHGDPSFMPPRRADWANINVFDEGDHAWMTDWSGWRHGLPVFRTWMPPRRAPPTPLYQRRRFQHLIMTPENITLQRRIAGLQGRAGLWLVGMYAVDVDNHESALLSAIPPARALLPESPNLRRLLSVVREQKVHDLSILPSALELA